MSSVATTLSGELEDPQLSAGGFPANPTALQENVRHLLMNVISQENLKESFGKLNPDGSFVKMFRGYVQVRMDGSLEDSSMTFPKWGIVSDGVVGELSMSVPAIDGSESSLLPTPTSRDHEDTGENTDYVKVVKKSKLAGKIALLPTVVTPRPHDSDNTAGCYYPTQNQEDLPQILGRDHGLKLQPAFAEWMMGFQEGWTALDASEMPSSRSKRTRSSRQSQTLKGRCRT